MQRCVPPGPRAKAQDARSAQRRVGQSQTDESAGIRNRRPAHACTNLKLPAYAATSHKGGRPAHQRVLRELRMPSKVQAGKALKQRLQTEIY